MKKADYYRDDGSAHKCWRCGSTEIKTIDRDRLPVLDNGDGPLLEYEEKCAKCDTSLAYWAYGLYNLEYRENPIFEVAL